jgi:hypothetical protein
MQSQEHTGIRQIRRMRLALLPLIATVVVILWMAARWPDFVYLLVISAMLPMFALIYIFARLPRIPCPRCGAPMLFAPQQGLNLHTGRCVHCGLPLRVEKVIYPSME